MVSNDVRLNTNMSNIIRHKDFDPCFVPLAWRKNGGFMEQFRLGEMEQRFADMIWREAPIASGQLAKRCGDEFGWKRTTAYTMLKRLCDRRLFANENGMVTVLMTREEFQAAQGEQFINDVFDGSLPRFLAAFSRRKKMSPKEVEALKKMIDEME